MPATVPVTVQRYNPETDSAPRYQTYEVPYKDDWVVLDAILYIKDHLDATLSYRWSCRMGICGSCGMNVDGSIELMPHVGVLDRIGLALKEEPGSVRVIGYTDDQPIRTIAFPSNFQLSTARAKEASTIIGASVGDPSRLSAEGRADADPIATNSTPEGRERNRRIEVVLNRQGA